MADDVSTKLNRLFARGKFRHMQLLLALFESGSVQRAAEKLGVTQSSATQSLASLESLLDVVLFERHARGVLPTGACLDLLPLARQMVQGVAAAAEALAARTGKGRGTVRLLVSSAALHGVASEILPRFAATRPELQVIVTEAEGDEQMQVVARGEIDLGILRSRDVFPSGWVFLPLLSDRMIVVCCANHPLARGRSPDLHQLAAQTWLQMPAGTQARALFEQLAARLPVPPTTYPVVTRSLGLVGELLRQAELLALLPQSTVRQALATGALVELQVDGLQALEPIGVLSPHSGMSHAASVLCEFLCCQMRCDALHGRAPESRSQVDH